MPKPNQTMTIVWYTCYFKGHVVLGTETYWMSFWASLAINLFSHAYMRRCLGEKNEIKRLDNLKFVTIWKRTCNKRCLLQCCYERFHFHVTSGREDVQAVLSLNFMTLTQSSTKSACTPNHRLLRPGIGFFIEKQKCLLVLWPSPFPECFKHGAGIISLQSTPAKGN